MKHHLRPGTLALVLAATIALGMVLAACSPEPATIQPPPTQPPPTAKAEAPPTAKPEAPPATKPGAPPTTAPAATEAPPTAAPAPEGPVWTADGAIGPDEYTDSVEEAGVTFHWAHDGEFLYGAVSAKTKGWVAVALDPENRMQGANYIYGYVKNGETTLFDMFGTKPLGPDSHPPDTELGGTDDIVAFAGSESDGVTTIEFQIPLDSGDKYDKALAPGSTYDVLVALGPSDNFAIHSGRGRTQITLQ